jgi:hypothetical protein
MGCPPHPSHSLVPWRVQIAHVGASEWARLVLDFSLGRATLAFGGKKKKILRIGSNFAWWFVASF